MILNGRLFGNPVQLNELFFQTTLTVVEVLRCRSPFRSPPSRLMHRTLTQMRLRTFAVHRRWYRSLWTSTTLAVESPTDLFVASHWLERSSSRFSVTLLVFSRADHSTLQVLTTFYVVFISTFYWRLASKAPRSSDLPLIGPRPWRHRPRLIVMHVVFRSLLKISVYAAKQACKLLQCNKANYQSQPQSMALTIFRKYLLVSGQSVYDRYQQSIYQQPAKNILH